MENLISKWKTAQNSLKTDKPRSNFGSSRKGNYDFSSSSDSEPEQRAPSNSSRYVLPVKSEMTVSSENSHRQLSVSPKKSERRTTMSTNAEAETKESRRSSSGKKQSQKGRPLEQNNNIDNRSRSQTKKTGSQEKRTPKKGQSPGNEENETHQKASTMKKGIPLLIDQASYKIMDIFKYNNDLSNQEKLQRVRKIVEGVVESTSTKTEELENQINNLRQEAKRITFMNRTDTSSKIIGELEAKLYESEREKLQLKKEKEQLSIQLANFEKENNMNNVNQELIQMLRKSQKLLEDTNNQLVNQLQEAKRREEEQQVLWQNEVNDLTDIMRMLKENLISQHPSDQEER